MGFLYLSIHVFFFFVHPFCIYYSNKSCKQHWFSNLIFVSSCLLLSVRVDNALRVKTKALRCGISALNIMTLGGSGGSYGKGLFLVCSHMKCHQEFDKIWRSNPLWELHWTTHFLILFSCYNQALTGDPCHCVIKLIICHKNYFWAPLSWGQENWQPSYTIKMIILSRWLRLHTPLLISQSRAASLLVFFISSTLSFQDIRKHLFCVC